METIETLITKIKDNKDKSYNLRLSISEQKIQLMDKVRKSLEKAGMKLSPKYPNSSDIFSLDNQVRISFGEGNFRIDLPHIIEKPNADIQFLVWSVLSKFYDDVMDIQLDMVNNNKIENPYYDDYHEAINMISKKMVDDFFTNGEISIGKIKYKYVGYNKGRFVVNIIHQRPSWKDDETKSYHKSKLVDIFKDEARVMADTLIKN
jgi:hypothetical protein